MTASLDTKTDATADTVVSDVRAGSGHAELDLTDSGPRYAPIGTLGRGGMGEVHLARDRRIGRDVALKVIGEHFRESSESRGRFVFEARLQGQLEHPAIVPVHDVGVDRVAATTNGPA